MTYWGNILTLISLLASLVGSTRAKISIHRHRPQGSLTSTDRLSPDSIVLDQPTMYSPSLDVNNDSHDARMSTTPIVDDLSHVRLLCEKGEHRAALMWLDKYEHDHGPSAHVYERKAQILSLLNEMSGAADHYERAITLDSSFLEHVGHRLALAYHHSGDDKKAEQVYLELLRMGQQSAELHLDYGVTLERLGKLLEANDQYNKAISLDQEFPQAWLNVAALHHQYGDVNESIPLYQKTLSIQTANEGIQFMALVNLGVAYEQTLDVRQALTVYEYALQHVRVSRQTPDDSDSISKDEIQLLVHIDRAKRGGGIWGAYEVERDHLLYVVEREELDRNRAASLLPFDSLLHSMAGKTRRKIAELYAAQFVQPFKKTAARSRVNDRVRLGYLSYDYSNHPTAKLIEGLFVYHNRSAFSAHAFGYGRDDGSEHRRRIRESADEFVDLSTLSTESSVDSIKQRQVDILMDVQAYTRRARTHIVAARSAPIQVNYLAYPGTLGASFIDYIIGDRFVVPPAENAEDYSEKLVILPACYQVNFYEDIDSSKSVDVQLVDIDPKWFVFVNFNKIDKLDPNVFATWMSILRRTPESVLVLLNPAKPGDESKTSVEIRANLLKEAASNGIHPHRIRFVLRVPKQEHIARHRHAGLFLDTFTYGAHSTATDALYGGLPVLTLAGDSFASRVGISLLSNVDHVPLITYSKKEFEDTAGSLTTSNGFYTRGLAAWTLFICSL